MCILCMQFSYFFFLHFPINFAQLWKSIKWHQTVLQILYYPLLSHFSPLIPANSSTFFLILFHFVINHRTSILIKWQLFPLLLYRLVNSDSSLFCHLINGIVVRWQETHLNFFLKFIYGYNLKSYAKPIKVGLFKCKICDKDSSRKSKSYIVINYESINHEGDKSRIWFNRHIELNKKLWNSISRFRCHMWDLNLKRFPNASTNIQFLFVCFGYSLCLMKISLV